MLVTPSSYPGFIPVNALANYLEVTWFRVQEVIVAAGNGVTAANYSYKLVNLTVPDYDQYFALVMIPSEGTVQSPIVRLILL